MHFVLFMNVQKVFLTLNNYKCQQFCVWGKIVFEGSIWIKQVLSDELGPAWTKVEGEKNAFVSIFLVKRTQGQKNK